jgi:hypothetical protein
LDLLLSGRLPVTISGLTHDVQSQQSGAGKVPLLR